MKALVAILLGLLISTPAIACRAKQKPDEKKLDSYKLVFSGEVLGVQLSEYEDALKKCDKDKKLDACPIDVWDTTEVHEVTVFADKIFRGDAPKIATLKIGGCGMEIPRVHQYGLFFVSDDGFVIPLYDDEGQYYWYWFYKLDGLKNPDNY